MNILKAHSLYSILSFVATGIAVDVANHNLHHLQTDSTVGGAAIPIQGHDNSTTATSVKIFPNRTTESSAIYGTIYTDIIPTPAIAVKLCLCETTTCITETNTDENGNYSFTISTDDGSPQCYYIQYDENNNLFANSTITITIHLNGDEGAIDEDSDSDSTDLTLELSQAPSETPSEAPNSSLEKESKSNEDGDSISSWQGVINLVFWIGAIFLAQIFCGCCHCMHDHHGSCDGNAMSLVVILAVIYGGVVALWVWYGISLVNW